MVGVSPLRRFFDEQADFQDADSDSSPLPALYADLAAHRSSNKTSFDASVDWWARLLQRACLVGAQSTPLTTIAASTSNAKGKQAERSSFGDRLVLHLNQQLIEECTVEEVGRPLGLGTVALDLQTHKRIYPLKSFLSSATPLSGPSTSRRRLSSIAYNIATTPLAWAFSQLSTNLGFGDGDDEEAGERDWKAAKGDWVLWENLETVTDAILDLHRDAPRLSPLESLYSLSSFQSKLVEPALSQLSERERSDEKKAHCSPLDLQVLIKFMTRDKGVAAADGQVIKLEHFQGEKLSAITEEERGVVNVKDTYVRLEGQIEEIEHRIKERQAKVESCLREKKRDQALSYLRSRKMLDELLEKRTKSLETLHGVLLKIEQAASDVEVVKAYELSTSSLKALLSDARLQPDRIDASMEQMQDTLADADEVRRAVEAGNEGMCRAAGEEEIDEGEMEAELKRLEEESRREEEEEKAKKRREEEEEKAEKRREEERKHSEKPSQQVDSTTKVETSSDQQQPQAEADKTRSEEAIPA